MSANRDSVTLAAAISGLVALVLLGSFAIWTAGHMTHLQQRSAASAMVKAPEIAAPLSHSIPHG